MHGLTARGAVGGGTPVTHRPTAWGQWVAELLQYTAFVPRGSGKWDCYNALPYCPGAVGGETLASHRLTAWGQWAAQVLLRTALLSEGQWAA